MRFITILGLPYVPSRTMPNSPKTNHKTTYRNAVMVDSWLANEAVLASILVGGKNFTNMSSIYVGGCDKVEWKTVGRISTYICTLTDIIKEAFRYCCKVEHCIFVLDKPSIAESVDLVSKETLNNLGVFGLNLCKIGNKNKIGSQNHKRRTLSRSLHGGHWQLGSLSSKTD